MKCVCLSGYVFSPLQPIRMKLGMVVRGKSLLFQKVIKDERLGQIQVVHIELKFT